MANAFKSKNGFKILYTQISWGTLSTHREEDKRVRRGKDAAKGATVIFWRLAGGEEEELLALRVLLFDLVAIFLRSVEQLCGGSDTRVLEFFIFFSLENLDIPEYN